jgi:hypothetical protein
MLWLNGAFTHEALVYRSGPLHVEVRAKDAQLISWVLEADDPRNVRLRKWLVDHQAWKPVVYTPRASKLTISDTKLYVGFDGGKMLAWSPEKGYFQQTVDETDYQYLLNN